MQEVGKYDTTFFEMTVRDLRSTGMSRATHSQLPTQCADCPAVKLLDQEQRETGALVTQIEARTRRRERALEIGNWVGGQLD